MKLKKFAVIAAAASLGLTLSACGDDAQPGETQPPTNGAAETREDATTQAPSTDDAQEATTEEATAPDTDASTDAPTDDTTLSHGSDWSAEADGEPFTMDGANVACAVQGEEAAIVIGSGAKMIAIQLSNDLEVTGFSMVDDEGKGLMYSKDLPVGSATATKDGNTYTVSGEGIDAGLGNLTDTTPFKVVVTCD